MQHATNKDDHSSSQQGRQWNVLQLQLFKTNKGEELEINDIELKNM